MTDTRTDEEVLCEFMGTRPNHKRVNRYQTCDWWVWLDLHRERPSPDIHAWVPRDLDLDDLREIEERLTEEQRLAYMLELSKGGPPHKGYWCLIHADAQKKIKALATVVRTNT